MHLITDVLLCSVPMKIPITHRYFPKVKSTVKIEVASGRDSFLYTNEYDF